MNIQDTTLPGVKLIQPGTFEDHRGYYVETYNEQLYKEHGVDQHFVQDDISVSYQNVLRGIHGDAETWKLISCLEGRFYFVVVNGDTESPDYGKWEAFNLSAANRKQVLVPPKHGNGHLVMSEHAIFHYKQTTYYNPKGQFTIVWNDPKFNIWWPTEKPILSRRDQQGHW